MMDQSQIDHVSSLLKHKTSLVPFYSILFQKIYVVELGCVGILELCGANYFPLYNAAPFKI